jgi:type II secretory pathway component PulF
MKPDSPHHEPARLPIGGVGELLNHAADGTAAGVPLDEVFLAVAEDADNRRLREVSRRLAEELRRGGDFRTALNRLDGWMPAYLRQALAASGDSGQAAAVLQGLAQHESARKRLRLQLWSALLYPVLVLGLLAIVSAGLVVVVLPQFVDLYREFDLQLPESTLVLLGIAQWMLWVVAAMAAVPAAYFILWLLPGGRRLAHWLRTGIPIFGRVFIWNGQHEFASVLGSLVTRRISLDDALRCTVISLHDRNLARATRIAACKCEDGMLLSRSLAESLHFDPALPALVAWGEAHDSLPDALRQAALMFEEEIDIYATFLRRILPPILFVMVIMTIFAFMTALIMPLMQLINYLM